eukprot:TRINITY_DN61857_c0_g1_i1.p1 TRINITY_DN61857_c0_g1~~TRINITY_DN61857_c0_g1_i1.p1  ORF type:complete len:662 (-),score=160.25 TRINITY_DN61857_c0_g1_i1:249-2141(-)
MIAAARPAASGRNVPGQGIKAQPKRKNFRVANAKMLRSNFKEIQESPEGADTDPLTLPKCVECNHCGWPVYPRESKVATRKTFARAGIERSSKKEEEAKRKAAIQAALEAGEDIPEELLAGAEDGEGSDADSRDTVEKMADEIQDLQDANQELDLKASKMESERDNLKEERDQLKEELESALEKIEFLEEAEERWRDKLTAARKEIDRLLLVNERASTVSADREAGLIKSILEIRALREEIATMKRRRALMLLQLQVEYKQNQRKELMGTMVKMWKIRSLRDRSSRQLDDLEARRRKEVTELQEQLVAERAGVKSLECTVSQMEGKLKQAAKRLLERSLGTAAWPSAQGHWLRAWTGLHPSVVLENELERTQRKLEETTVELQETKESHVALTGEVQVLREERDSLTERVQQLIAEVEFIKLEAGLDDESMARKRAAEKAKEDAWNAKVKGVQDKLDAVEEEYATVKEDLMKQLKATQSRLQITEDALAAASGGPGTGEAPDAFRVVPNGQGVLCTGCLRQLLLREVKPLPPKSAMTDSAPDLETARRAFFKKELGGRLQTDDPLHKAMFETAKDPYRLSKLSREPLDPITSPGPSPTTGLPALKKAWGTKSGSLSLKSSMQNFRPRAFR